MAMWWIWMVAADFRCSHSPSQLAWSGGWRPPGAQSTFIKWTEGTLTMNGHDDSTIYIVVVMVQFHIASWFSYTVN